LKKHFTSPPNAFDEFETFPLVRAKTDAEQRLEAMNKLERFIQERDTVIKERDAVIKERDAVIKERDAVISGIFNSRIWKLTHPKWLARFRVSMR
jgi:hypothetical protein